MKSVTFGIPNYVKSIFLRLAIVLIFLQVTRLIFYLYNSSFFPDAQFSDVLAGVWFDCVTICLYFLPYYALFLLPLPIRNYHWHKTLFAISFHVTLTFMVMLNLIDCAYFPYTQKRSSRDLIGTIFTGDDFGQLVGTFLIENWLLVLLFIGFILLSLVLYRKTVFEFETQKSVTERFYLKNSLWLLVLMPLFLAVGRGSLGKKPLGVIDAAKYTLPENAALVMNTPFTFLKTIATVNLQQKNYMSQEEEMALFDPIRTSQPANLLPDSTNVMIIILESFGKEFVGTLSGKKTYTPFFDSLLTQSRYYEYAFANGKKSNEALPSILASIPSLLEEPLISSSYAGNKVDALPKILGEVGYTSSFYHGATNGSMRFDAYAKSCGFDRYVGRSEYPNDSHFDGLWAISDGYFNPWVAKDMSTLKQPFLSTLFTTSSHHPYIVPKEFVKHTIDGPQEICRAISYADYALKLFFETAKKQPWYENTLFIFVADHTPASTTKLYSQRQEMYRIPIAFFHPKKLIIPEKRTEIAQQLDIFPSILDLLNVKKRYYSFGSSLFQPNERQAFVHLQGFFYYFHDKQMMTFSAEKAQNLLNFTKGVNSGIDSLRYYPEKVLRNENKLKAILQRYARDVVTNQTRVHE